MTQSSPAKRGLPPHPSDPSSLPVASPPARLTGPQADTLPSAAAVAQYADRDAARMDAYSAAYHSQTPAPDDEPSPWELENLTDDEIGDLYDGQDFKRASGAGVCGACGHHITGHPDGEPCVYCAAQGTSCPRFR